MLKLSDFSKVCFSLFVGIIFFGCDLNDDLPTKSSNSNIGRIEIHGYPDENNRILFYISASKMTVNWGDGRIDIFTSKIGEIELEYEYSNRNYQTISVETESMISFSFGFPIDNIQNFGYAKGTIHELRFEKCPGLREIFCNVNNLGDSLKVLNFNECTDLKRLWCEGNHISYLDVSNCRVLEQLWCGRNKLDSLNISDCTELWVLYCNDNELSTSNLEQLFENLPNIKYGEAFMNIGCNPGVYSSNWIIAQEKGWRIFDDCY